ncbi:hypothetical protein [Bradyrhizobium sp. RT4b]|uniref:hypothetical protein n=1 Tax=unclassified Bradyrhizobium TaxID=2631580 RepID=UPI0033958AA7
MEVSIFTWHDAMPAGVSIDFWTAQLGMVETNHLPARARVIAKWSDVCLRRALHSHLLKASCAVEDYYGINVRNDGSNSEAYLQGESQLAATLASVCSKASIGSVAVVDVASCGLSSLDWSDIIPLLKRSYKVVVCVDYAIPELTSLEAGVQDGCSTDRISLDGLKACDGWEIASDELLSTEPIVSYEQRAALYTAYVSVLIDELSAEL